MTGQFRQIGGGALPGSGDFADILNGGTITISSVVPSCYQLYVGSGAVQMTGGSLNFAGVLYLYGSGSTATFTQSGGSFTIPSNGAGISIDALSNGTSTYNLSNGYPATIAIHGNDLVLTVPEPSTMVLFAAGVLGLIGWAWRRRQAMRV